jgi:hypothetical protein
LVQVVVGVFVRFRAPLVMRTSPAENPMHHSHTSPTTWIVICQLHRCYAHRKEMSPCTSCVGYERTPKLSSSPKDFRVAYAETKEMRVIGKHSISTSGRREAAQGVSSASISAVPRTWCLREKNRSDVRRWKNFQLQHLMSYIMATSQCWTRRPGMPGLSFPKP